MDKKMKAAFDDALLQRDCGSTRDIMQGFTQGVEWTLDYLRSQQEPWHWIVQRYGSQPDKGWNIWAGRYPEQCANRNHIACLGDGDEAEKLARHLCDAHNAANEKAKKEN